MKNNAIFGVSQSHSGHEYRWIFTAEEIKNQIHFDPKTGDCEDFYWPMGGSNSSATYFEELTSDDEILGFLTTPGEPDLDDPELVDIGEYLMTVEVGDGSITQEYLDKFGLGIEDCTVTDDCYGRKEEILRHSQDLKEIGFTDFDYDNPFYGTNRDMRYSEFCDMYEENMKVYEENKEM